MAIYRGPGGSGDATTDATAEATVATLKAAEAKASATAAALSASNAANSETNATNSETEASTYASNASNSADAAALSESNVAASASSANTSATNAATSETNAATSETNAETAETNATASASAASSSASAASTSETNAAASAAAAAATKDSIDEFYLGAQASNPTLDNNGDAVTTGDWYFNTVANETRVYDGSLWQVTAISTAGFLTAANNLSDVTSVSTARTNLELGTAATTDSTAYATAAQGSLADSALQTETNDLSAAVTWANIPDANVPQSAVTQHQAALTLTESQISDLQSYLLANQTITLSGDVSGSGTTSIAVTIADDSHNHTIANVDNLQTTLDAKVVKTSNTGSAELPSGTEAQRDGSPAAGYIRFNSDSGSFEGYDGAAWGSIGGGGGASAGGAIYENTDDITADYTLTTGTNGMSVGPMTIASGVTVTVPSGQRWVIL